MAVGFRFSLSRNTHPKCKYSSTTCGVCDYDDDDDDESFRHHTIHRWRTFHFMSVVVMLILEPFVEYRIAYGSTAEKTLKYAVWSDCLCQQLKTDSAKELRAHKMNPGRWTPFLLFNSIFGMRKGGRNKSSANDLRASREARDNITKRTNNSDNNNEKNFLFPVLHVTNQWQWRLKNYHNCVDELCRTASTSLSMPLGTKSKHCCERSAGNIEGRRACKWGTKWNKKKKRERERKKANGINQSNMPRVFSAHRVSTVICVPNELW